MELGQHHGVKLNLVLKIMKDILSFLLRLGKLILTPRLKESFSVNIHNTSLASLKLKSLINVLKSVYL